MDPTTAAPTAQNHPHSHSSTLTSAGARPQKPSICNCSTTPNQSYLQPLIGCANSKCRPRYYHLRCVGLFHRPHNEFTWLCPSCRPDEPLPPRICNCEDPPYRTGPMVECTQQERCATRWFHLPCTGIWPAEDCSQWMCAECVVGIVMQQEREEEMERRRTNGEVVEDEEDELVQREFVSDGVSGVFLGEDNEPRQASPATDPQTEATGAAHVDLTEQAPVDVATPQDEILPSSRTVSPDVRPAASLLKRKSDEADSPSRKKTKRASPTSTPSPEPEEEPEYCVCGTPADDDMIACDAANCQAEWFHFVCVGLTAATIPEGDWYCDDCAEVMEKKKEKKKKKSGKGKGKGKRKR